MAKGFAELHKEPSATRAELAEPRAALREDNANLRTKMIRETFTNHEDIGTIGKRIQRLGRKRRAVTRRRLNMATRDETVKPSGGGMQWVVTSTVAPLQGSIDALRQDNRALDSRVDSLSRPRPRNPRPWGGNKRLA